MRGTFPTNDDIRMFTLRAPLPAICSLTRICFLRAKAYAKALFFIKTNYWTGSYRQEGGFLVE